MKKISIFQIVLLAAFGALAVAGVLIFAFAIGGNTGSSVGSVKIWGTLDSSAFAAVIRNAADTNTDLSQVTYVQKDPATYDSDITKALASGTGPDLILITQADAYKDSGEIAAIPSSAITESQFTSTFINAADPLFGSSGALAIPIVADPLVLFWNKDMLASGGSSSPPAYWDQLFTLAQKITAKDTSGDIVKSAVAIGEFQNVDHAKDILTTLIMQAGGTLTAFDSAGRLTSALIPKTGGGSSAAGESALRFYTEFADPSKTDYSWNRSLPDAQQAFISGDLALYIGYASEAGAISRSNPNLNFGIAALPQVRSAANTETTARVYGLAATRTSNASSAITVAAALATAENSQALSTALGLPSARRDILSSAAAKQIPGNLASTNDICQGVDPIVCSTQIAHTWTDPDPGATDTIFQDMIENTTSGAVTVTQALQRADQQMTQLLSKQ